MLKLRSELIIFFELLFKMGFGNPVEILSGSLAKIKNLATNLLWVLSILTEKVTHVMRKTLLNSILRRIFLAAH